MVILLTIVHVIVCLFLVLVVLLQSGKAADLAGAFGGMGSQTVFGPRGSATVLSKATTVAAGLFMITSLTLAIMATTGGGGSVGSTVLEQQGSQAQKTEGQTTPAPQAPVTVTPEGGQPIEIPVAPPPAPAEPAKPAEKQ
ncbi:MAG: preprotein translocase subunit SecG [Bryobacteraceae bacterium]|nr:preprotein translocase subunit SecG [Bryobacteraceae bacterium]